MAQKVCIIPYAHHGGLSTGFTLIISPTKRPLERTSDDLRKGRITAKKALTPLLCQSMKSCTPTMVSNTILFYQNHGHYSTMVRI